MSTDVVLFERHDAACCITEQAEQLKAAALARSAVIGAVKNASQNDSAAAACRDIRGIIKAAEKAADTIKRPLIDAQRAVNAKLGEYLEDLKTEDARLMSACGNFAQAEMERVRAEQRRVAEEQAKIERAKQAELDRIRRESEAAAAQAKTKAESLRIAAEAQANSIVAEERAKAQAEAVKPAPVIAKAAGQSVKPTWKFEVVDMWLLARTSPGLVRIEPNLREINEVITRLAENGAPTIAGLRIWKETVVSVRAPKQGEAIEV